MAPIIIATSESRSKASIPGQPENKNGLVVVPFVDERFFILSHASSNPGFIMQKVDSVLHIVNCEDPSDAQHSEYHHYKQCTLYLPRSYIRRHNQTSARLKHPR